MTVLVIPGEFMFMTNDKVMSMIVPLDKNKFTNEIGAEGVPSADNHDAVNEPEGGFVNTWAGIAVPSAVSLTMVVLLP